MTSVLLIEDHISILENTAELLELEGFHVVMANNGKVGLQKLADFVPDIIICDLLMPEMDGLTLLGTLGKHPDYKKIPFIFFSAKSEKTDIKLGLDAGADDYLVKPFEFEELLESIKKCLVKR
ncbi:MAG: response regulator [Saonia sp.]